MAYVAVPRWQHGDNVTHTQLNILGDDISWLNSLQGGIDWNLGVLNIGDNVNRSKYFVIHKYRWLWYTGDGYLELFVAVNGNKFRTSLSSETVTGLDLDSLGWLHYANRYVIGGVSWALETRDA